MKKIIKFILIFIILISFWILPVYANVKEEYTENELEYINNHKQIYIAGSSEIELVESYNGKDYEGILPEIFEKISDISGIKFTYINENNNWQEYVKNNQVEIVTGILEDADVTQYNLKSKIDVIKFPIKEQNKIYSIAFTQIADDELVEIVRKSLNNLDDFTKQEVFISNLINYNENFALEHILILICVIFGVVGIAFFVLYKKYKKEVANAKYIDNITKMDNYQAMEIKFNLMTTDNTRCSYCIINMGIDITHIEEIYGYSEVEKILKDVAQIINKNIEEKEIFARIYKDSFVIMADYISEKSIIERINFIIDEIKEHEKEKNKQYEITINTGVYILKQIDKNLEEAVYNAMLARKEAKNQGNRIRICTEALIMKVRKDNHLEREIITALENNEFYTYVQPLIDLKIGKPVAFEMLARWESPKFGLIKPSNFLDILEKNNLTFKLDLQMYENTCKMLAKMREEGKELITVFCNFSRKTIENRKCYDQLKEIADKYEIPEKYIGIIIQERTVNKNTENLKFVIHKLKKAGFIILLDDFDASYYSFRDISEFNIDYIKISSRLTDSLDDDRTSDIIKGIIDIVHRFDIKVICEEFKTKKNEQILKDIGCDLIQGDAYYQPIPIEEL